MSKILINRTKVEEALKEKGLVPLYRRGDSVYFGFYDRDESDKILSLIKEVTGLEFEFLPIQTIGPDLIQLRWYNGDSKPFTVSIRDEFAKQIVEPYIQPLSINLGYNSKSKKGI